MPSNMVDALHNHYSVKDAWVVPIVLQSNAILWNFAILIAILWNVVISIAILWNFVISIAILLRLCNTYYNTFEILQYLLQYFWYFAILIAILLRFCNNYCNTFEIL